MQNCRTLEEAIDANYDYLDVLTPRNIAAFWGAVPRLLKKWNKKSSRNGYEEKMFHHLNEISTLTMEKIDTFGYRDLATVAVSFAKITEMVGNPEARFRKGSPHQTLRDLLIGQNSEIKEWIFKRIARVAVLSLPQFDARSLSNLIYAYGLAKHIPKFEDGRALFDILAMEAIEKLATFNSHDLSNMLWAYATLGASNPRLFEEAGDNICLHQDLSNFKPQHLSNILWAYAEAKESHPWLFRKVADHIIALDNLSQFNSQDFSNTVWAYATAEESHPRLFKKVAGHIVGLDNLSHFKPQGLSNIAWAFATAEEPDPKLFRILADFAIRKRNEFNSQEVANFLWAFASNGLIDQHLFTTFVPKTAANLSECNSQNLANIGWAYAVANVDAPSLFNDEFINACIEKEPKFIPGALGQLHQWQLWREELNSNIRLPPLLREKCYKAFLTTAPAPSALQNDVFAELSSIGLKPEEEVLTNRGYRLDAVVEANGKRIGIEVDGPFHFLERKPKGRTILKHRQVTSLEGIPVVSLPYWEWDQLGKDRSKKQQYLRSLLHLSSSK